MKTGDIVTDSRAQAWTLGALLGEGVWGRTWLVKDDEGHQRVLKAPYEAEDLPPAGADRVPLMRASAEEQADLLATDNDLLVTLEDRITLPTGATALLLPWYPTTLHRQLSSGLPLIEALNILHAVTAGLATYGRNHGNLRPSNILIDPHGSPVLMDLATHSSQSLMHAHDRANPRRKPWAPADRIAPDTWAICQALYAATMLDESDASGSDRSGKPAEIPTAGTTGLDKVALATLKDRAVARLKLDGANNRFVLRTAERMSTILARGLSKEADPSPPYRFLKSKELEPRLREVNALTDPGVENVGKLLLASTAEGDVFQGPAAVGFTVSVAATEGVDDPSDLVCGVRLTDLDAPGDGRVSLEDAQFTVDKHPSGRLRFEFNLPDVDPGRYAVRVAFSVRDSGHDPVVAEGRFEVRPPPGYVPPAEPDAGPAPIQFIQRTPPPDEDGFDDEDEDDDEEAPTVQMSAEEMRRRMANLDGDEGTAADDEPGAEIIDAFPRPLAPTGPGTFFEDEEEEDEAPHEPAASAGAPAPLAAVPTPAPSEPGSAPSTPAVAQPQPSVTVAKPADAGASASPTAGTPVGTGPSTAGVASTGAPASTGPVVQAPPPPAPLPAGNEWQSSQTGEADFFADDAPYASSGIPGMDDVLPGAGADDLLEAAPARPSAFADLRQRFAERLRRDLATSVGVAVAGCFILVVIMMALVSAC